MPDILPCTFISEVWGNGDDGDDDDDDDDDSDSEDHNDGEYACCFLCLTVGYLFLNFSFHGQLGFWRMTKYHNTVLNYTQMYFLAHLDPALLL